MGKKGLFVTFEGTDGVGKSTQAKRLAEWLADRGHEVALTREPGGGRVAEQIRRLLLDPSLEMNGLTELLLYEAARVEHLESVVRPALAEGKTVLCDRFIDSTTAYQGYARGLLKQTERLNAIATSGLKPDLTILLTLAPHIGLAKALARNGNKGDRLENEGVSFQRKVAAGFLKIAKGDPNRIKIVPVQDTVEETQFLIQKWVGKKLNGHHRTTARAALSR